MKAQRIIIVAIVFANIISIIPISLAFEYNWEIDETPEGQESYTPLPVSEFELIDDGVNLSNSTASINLKSKFNVNLSDTFSSRQSALLLEVFNKLPDIDMGISYWVVAGYYIPDDIIVVRLSSFNIVILSEYAFNFSSPMAVKLDGVKGKVQSFRLFKAVVRYMTDNGLDKRNAKKIMQYRYGIELHANDYRKLTEGTTVEDNDRFEEFKSEEIVSLIYMLEQFPTGMLKIEGLNYVIRRRDGLSHPYYPEAPAVAWTSAGYIEFMESAFTISDISHIHRLILHEKAHFLWEYMFDKQLKQDWIELGEWYQDNNGVWYTKQETQFVSAYAHGVNPNEDMAESISYYVVNPDKLRNHAPKKYGFIRDRIMHGTRYLSKIREDLTFKVYNLWPDYVYPGKVISTHVKVIGEPEEDKKVRITFTTYSENENDYGSSICFRLQSPGDVSTDIYLYAVDADGNRVSSSNIYTIEYTMSKYMASGYWTLKNLSVIDTQGLWRGQSINDIGFQLYLDNPLEDSEPPTYIANSMKLSISDATTKDGLRYQMLTAQWKAKDSALIPHFRIWFNNITYPERSSLYISGRAYADSTVKDDDGNQILTTSRAIADYYPGGIYAVSAIAMGDIAGNGSVIRFINDVNKSHVETDQPTVSIEIKTPNPDFQPPELDVNNIFIRAEPYDLVNPDGKTRVEIIFRVKDDNSGYTSGSCFLRSPDGKSHVYHIYDPNPYRIYFEGDPTVWKKYIKTIVLPEGSQPGIWGLASMSISDKAENYRHYDFTEIIRFDVDLNIDASPQTKSHKVLTTKLFSNFPNPFNPETWIPYELAKPANVMITIYDTDGQVVRKLDIGYQNTGRYVKRKRAAYWDGKNSLGEPVASGLYFYTLTARKYVATRRLLILK